jgi:hypothetical protein
MKIPNICTTMAYAFNRALGIDTASSPYLDKLLVKQQDKLIELVDKQDKLIHKLYDAPDFRVYRDMKVSIAKLEYEIILQRSKIERTINRINLRKIKVGI